MKFSSILNEGDIRGAAISGNSTVDTLYSNKDSKAHSISYGTEGIGVASSDYYEPSENMLHSYYCY